MNNEAKQQENAEALFVYLKNRLEELTQNNDEMRVGEIMSAACSLFEYCVINYADNYEDIPLRLERTFKLMKEKIMFNLDLTGKIKDDNKGIEKCENLH